ncbi:related to SRC1-regulation of cohesion (Splice variant I) [Rhynchosporium agropyri]|uniref:Related to SRC1-regulation of cohesion (Splice variant I) n=1 Tax=Rhynchosporium agropyri TaxID=914238 RepID=A0A1E1LMT3_9HELO|nr:related to SRC1-regulation of cohesion (Splice variant I) [Rhynchosporium agropyri]
MSDTDSLDYLQTGFDPSTLTVPRLRSILVSHDVPYLASAKKPQLIEIFNDQVLPQAKKILSIRARARRTSRGITDADSQDSTVDDDEDMMPPPPTPRARSSRQASLRYRSEESESDAPVAVSSPTKRTPRASNVKRPRASESETGMDIDGARKSIRKTRKSEASTAVLATAPPPRIKSEEYEDRPRTSRRESGFTNDNPFQSGSSPLTGLVSTEKKRKSLGAVASKTPRKSTSGARRRTDGFQADADEGIHPPTSSTFEIPVSRMNGLVDVDENGVEASEEFTPEEQLEIEHDLAVNGMSAVGPLRPKRQQRRGFSLKGPLMVAALTVLGGWAGWYRSEKVAVGYCGVGRDPTPVIPAGVDVPDWVRILAEPQCELCPQHAYCSENLETHCEADFVLKPHPLGLGGIIPLPPTCEPDGEKARKVKAVADKVVDQLRDRRAKWECGSFTDEAGLPEPTVEISTVELKKDVMSKRKKGMAEGEFEDLWTAAIGEIQAMDEITSVVDGHRHLISSTSLIKIPFSCQIRRSLRLTLARYRLEIAGLLMLTLFSLYLRSAISSRSLSNAQIPNLVSLTLDRLATQAALHAQDKEAVPENWISIGQLRDDVLRDEHSIRKREALWTKVRAVVETNANVRASQREGRNGVISRVWEWIGAVPSLESGGERRRKSGRVSWGVYDDRSSPVSGNDGGPQIVQNRWEESRPIY